LNPEEEGTHHSDHTNTKTQCLKDYIDKKLIAKIELDPHILGQRLSFDECRIVDRSVRKQLNDILSQPASVKKSEKQSLIASVLDRICRNEVTYVGEIYLKQTQVNILRASYSKLFGQLNGLKQWFKQKVLGTLVGNLRQGVQERFIDLMAVCQEADDVSGQVKLWSVFRFHAPEIKKALDRVCNGLDDIGSGSDA